jgi:hypothetical protein
MYDAVNAPGNCGTVNNDPPQYTIRQSAIGGDDIKIAVEPFTRIISSTASSYVLYDANLISNTSTLTVTDHLVSVSKTDNISDITIYSLNTNVVNTIDSYNGGTMVASGVNTGSTSIVASGINLINNFSIADVQITRIGGQSITSFSSYLNGTLGKHCSDAIDTRIVGKNSLTTKPIFTTQNHSNSTYVRNTNCWAYDLDLTCISPWNTTGANTMAGTLISPCHIVFATHFQIDTGAKIRFITNNNVVIERTMIDKIDIANDITLGILDSDVPGTISFAKILPSNWSNYLPNLWGNSAHPTNNSTLCKVPILCLDQEEKALVHDMNIGGGNCGWRAPITGDRLSFYEPIVLYDSGNPCFLIVNNSLVLMSTYSYSVSGPFYPAYITSINTGMNTLWTRNGKSGSSYSITTVDLTGFTSF